MDQSLYESPGTFQTETGKRTTQVTSIVETNGSGFESGLRARVKGGFDKSPI